MSEFKITYKTTLYEMQEYCKNEMNTCKDCTIEDFCKEWFAVYPNEFGILKSKTYAEDFLEKFPKAFKIDGVPSCCVADAYGGLCGEYSPNGDCRECWNQEIKIEE